MNPATSPASARPAVIQQRLDEAQRRYNVLRLVRRVGTALVVVSVLWFALLLSVERGWLTSLAVFQALAGTGSFAAVFMGLCLVSVTLSRQRSHAFLAAAVEGARPALLDRLHALVELEGRPSNHPVRRHFAPAIARQAAAALGGKSARPLYPRARAWTHFLVGIACAAGTVWFALHFNPLRNLVSGKVAPTTAQGPTDAPFELGSKNTAEIAGQEAWGEVRIVEPGRDQKLTKLDVVPLRIEMAARDPLDTHEWITSVNGGPEVAHPLDASPEPCFAAYSPLLYLDELQVADWDVVSYYARARTTKGSAYSSQIYFVEIRPFRDDLMKNMPGGDKGKGYQLMAELSRLTADQGRILRDTHQHEQMTYPRPELQAEDRRKLAGAEHELATATDHVYSEITSQLENADVGTVLTNLDAAEMDMNRSTDALRSDVVGEGKARQAAALSELVATRKALQRAISDHPDKFGDGSNGGDDENVPTADQAKSSLKALQQVSEFRDQEKAAEAAMKQLAADQKIIANTTYQQYDKKAGELALQEAELIKKLDDISRDNPALFAHAQETLQTARAGMEEARQDLHDRESTYTAHSALAHAYDYLNDLNRSLDSRNGRRDLERAYAMKRLVDQSARSFQEAEARPDARTPAQADAMADQASGATRMLKGVSGGSFGPALPEALSAEKQAQLDQALQKFRSGKSKARAQAAADARANLENVSKAFDASRPASVQDMAKNDALGEPDGKGQGQGPGQSGTGALDHLLEQLQSLALQDQNGHQALPETRAKQRTELLRALEAELPQEFGDGDGVKGAVRDALAELTKTPGMPVDAEALKHLQEKLESMQAEASEKAAARQAAEGTSVADASRAPASYRQRLQRYYETLSQLKR